MYILFVVDWLVAGDTLLRAWYFPSIIHVISQQQRTDTIVTWQQHFLLSFNPTEHKGRFKKNMSKLTEEVSHYPMIVVTNYLFRYVYY